MKFEQNCSAALEKKSFENVNGRTHVRTDGRTDDGRKVITIAHPEQSSGELKMKFSLAVDLSNNIFSLFSQFRIIGIQIRKFLDFRYPDVRHDDILHLKRLCRK